MDYETFSDVELGGPNAKGLPNYVASPNFRPLMVCTSGGDAPAWFDFVMQDAWLGFDYIQHHDPNGEDYTEETIEEAWRFRLDYEEEVGHKLVAQNAPFERAVTKHMFPDFDVSIFVDSAVAARLMGADGSLKMASRQLTDEEKMEEGADLIQLFCVPNELYPMGATRELILKHGHLEKWELFKEYCGVDANNGQEIRETVEQLVEQFDPTLVEREDAYEFEVTYEMNQNGWHTDLPLVEKMEVRSWANDIIAQRIFARESEENINFNSHVQLKKFCEDRGVEAKSLDKYHLPVVLERTKARIEKLEDKENTPQIQKAILLLSEVVALLETKLEIGGSTLSKLPAIIRLVSSDARLRDQYMHIGAGATYRTTGRGAQLQNIKKLDGDIKDMETIYDIKHHWSNGDMAGQLRQVFCSAHEDGRYLVADFVGVESRGRSFAAGEQWMLDAVREGLDPYKALVTRMVPGLAYDDVTPALRPRGKYTELSCGYQASGKAVQDFMFRLGFVISIEEATQNVIDWRAASPASVQLWYTLDDLVKDVVRYKEPLYVELANGLTASIAPFTLPSMEAQHPDSVSICVQLRRKDGTPLVTRFVHGCYFMKIGEREQLVYYKPAKSLGDEGLLWDNVNHTATQKANKGRDPKLPKLIVYNSMYGGKLTGILIQSMCREIYFESTLALARRLKDVPNALLIGQFHDETVVEWWPGEYSEEQVKEMMEEAMTQTSIEDFPLSVEVKSAYRYIK